MNGTNCLFGQIRSARYYSIPANSSITDDILLKILHSPKRLATMLSNNGKLYVTIAMHLNNAIETAYIKTTKRSTLRKEWIELMGYFIIRLPTPVLTDSRRSALTVTTYSAFSPTHLASII